MNISLSSNAIQLFNTSAQKATNAADEIAKAPIQTNEIGSSDFNRQDIIKPVLSLKEAELETSAATKLLQTESEMIGSILDIEV